MKRILYAAALAMIIAQTAKAQTTKPIRYTWIATSCETWNCAAAAMVLANGDKHVIVLPTGREEQPWIVLRRVEEGSIFIPDDEPYACEVFDTVPIALAHFNTTDSCRAPLILNVPDGRAVITSLRTCGTESKRRAVR